MRQYNKLIEATVYAWGHFLVDFTCALALTSGEFNALQFFLYNFLAFAMQMPIGLLADRVDKNRMYTLTGIGLALLGCMPLEPWVRVTALGLGNACYHVGGGRQSLLHQEGFTGLGFFVAPGALGIFLGTILGGSQFSMVPAAVGLILTSAAVLSFCKDKGHIGSPGPARISTVVWMLAIVILRSLVGLTLDSPWKTGLFVASAAVAATAGKFLGGFIADRSGFRITGTTTLVLAALAFLFPDSGILGVLGVLLFNMSMPLTLGRASESLPGYEGFAFGLLTFGLFLGYIPAWLGWTMDPWLGSVLALVSAVMMALDRGDNG